ncbi:AraC family transcriptional regulator [Sphingomonas sp. MM-1]|uniref:helix-turn-helix transcriptional regulator n=1 Tax=Sphingomonas sp. MM-1 TaxID=745310 RepID=UPI0002C0EC22|nr:MULTISPECIES: AraC family transcriptional regulator [unclassified Sphingomonas]AGH49639.1 AraC family transcriptional regulator [Sphingomonas sp. MM-1]MDX3884102.1 AraC family transcriptional regulator [Sphingomonas sp.]
MAHTNWTTLAETRAGGVVAQLRQYELPTPVEMTVRETQPVISMMMPPYPVERLGRYEGAGADYHGLGNIVFTPAAADCQFRGDGGRPVSISCLFDPALFDRVVPIGEGWSRSRLAATLDIGGTAGGAIDRLLRRMAEELRAPGFAADIMVEGLGLATLAELARFLRAGKVHESRESGRLSAGQLRRLEEYVDAFPRQPPTIATLARLLGISPRRLTTLFRDTTGLTVRAWVEGRRMEQARRLLTEGDLPLKAIAYDLGFANQGVFSTAFRRIAGMTPSAYRDAYR